MSSSSSTGPPSLESSHIPTAICKFRSGMSKSSCATSLLRSPSTNCSTTFSSRQALLQNAQASARDLSLSMKSSTVSPLACLHCLNSLLEGMRRGLLFSIIGASSLAAFVFSPLGHLFVETRKDCEQYDSGLSRPSWRANSWPMEPNLSLDNTDKAPIFLNPLVVAARNRASGLLFSDVVRIQGSNFNA